VGLAFATLAFSVVLGLALVSLVTWAWRTVQSRSAGEPGLSQPYAALLLGGLLVSILVAGIISWWLLAPLKNPYRQIMLSAVSAFGAFLLALMTTPIEIMFGRVGLLGLFLGAAMLAAFLWRRVQRARSPG
jgi:hypothetical protein